jgi:hypothetical protein
MAKTKRNAMLIEEARSKIQTTQLINRLQNHALGKIDLSPTQVRSVEILLKKKIPDLQAVTLAGHDGEALPGLACVLVPSKV